jgi:hypothetical protein
VTIKDRIVAAKRVIAEVKTEGHLLRIKTSGLLTKTIYVFSYQLAQSGRGPKIIENIPVDICARGSSEPKFTWGRGEPSRRVGE